MSTPIIQFGTSRFLQAHADLFVSEAMRIGKAVGPITVVQTTLSAERGKRLAALAAAGGFPVHIRGLERGLVVDRIVQVTSVKHALSAHADWRQTVSAFITASIAICNTADNGYDISAEPETTPDGAPISFPGKLTKLLLERFHAGGAPMTILPAELIPRNGDVLGRIVGELADRWALPPSFRDWLARDIVFCNTLVDRIVSAPIEPAGAIAEPYALWAIEQKPGLTLPCEHPSIVVADDILSYERLKLFILNLGHTLLTDRWMRSDWPKDMLVRKLIGKAEYSDYLRRVYETDIIPGFASQGMAAQARSYVEQTFERFSNPFLDHRLSDIAQNHDEKIRRRAGGFLEWAQISAPHLEKLIARLPAL